jgi:hypothetical protein
MTRLQLKAIVRECVAEWFGRMKRTGEISATKRHAAAVAKSQKETEDRLWRAIRKKRPMYEHLLASEREHAKGAVEMLIDQVTGVP